jgi:hypothetical protein
MKWMCQAFQVVNNQLSVAVLMPRSSPSSLLAKGHEATIVAARANWLALQLREPAMENAHCTMISREPWNKGKLVGQKSPFKLKEIWAIRVRLQLANRHRELALFNLAIDSKLRVTWSGCASETSATEAPWHPGQS